MKLLVVQIDHHFESEQFKVITQECIQKFNGHFESYISEAKDVATDPPLKVSE